MSYTTRNCETCGKLMIHVDSRRRTCRECSKEQANPPPKRRIKPITQCVREAAALGISYGQYVQRGYDKIILSTIKQKEKIRKNGCS